MTKAQLTALINAQTKLAEHIVWALIEVRDATAGRDYNATDYAAKQTALETAISTITTAIPDDPE